MISLPHPLEYPARERNGASCISLACMSLARKNQTLLNMSRMGGDAYVGHPQKRAARHCVNFQAIALLQSHVRDETLHCRMDYLLPIETEGSRCDLAGHVKERPSCARKFLFKFVKIETALDRHPGARIRLVFEPERLREESAPFDQNGSRCDQLYSLSARWGSQQPTDRRSRPEVRLIH